MSKLNKEKKSSRKNKKHSKKSKKKKHRRDNDDHRPEHSDDSVEPDKTMLKELHFKSTIVSPSVQPSDYPTSSQCAVALSHGKHGERCDVSRGKYEERYDVSRSKHEERFDVSRGKHEERYDVYRGKHEERYDVSLKTRRSSSQRHFNSRHHDEIRSTSRDSDESPKPLRCWPCKPVTFDPIRDWRAVQTFYDPLMAGSIDGTDRAPHDRAVERALSCKHRPNRGVLGDPHRTLFVGRLPSIFTPTEESALRQLAEKYWGRVSNICVPRCPVTGEPRRYAFVELTSRYDAERTADAWRAAAESPAFILNGSHLLIDKERGRLMTGWRPRRLGGGIGGNKESGQLRFGGPARPFRKPILPSTLN